MSDENEALVRAAYEAYGRGDMTGMLVSRGDKVMVVVHAPGLDRHRARSADDRNYLVLTLRQGQVVALRACRDRVEAVGVAGLEPPRS